MKVIAMVQSTEKTSDGVIVNDPVEIKHYTGDSMPDAMSAVVAAMADAHNDPRWYTTISIRVDF